MNLFSLEKVFTLVDGTTSINTNHYPYQQYISTIVSNSTIDRWQDLTVAALISKLFTDYRRTPILANEDSIVAVVQALFNTALNAKLMSVKAGAIDANGNYPESGIGVSETNPAIYNTLANMVKKTLAIDASRLDKALNASNNAFVEFNETIFKVGDHVEIIVFVKLPATQKTYLGLDYINDDPVKVKVVLVLV
jgi:hypothetical protein